jgi:hypothetical protein
MLSEADHLKKVNRLRVSDKDLDPLLASYTVYLIIRSINGKANNYVTGCTREIEGGIYKVGVTRGRETR